MILAAWLLACGAEVPAPAPSPVAAPVAAPAPPPAAATCDPQVAFRPAEAQVKSPLAAAPTPELQRTRDTLLRVVQDHARDPQNPWAVVHGMLALGPDLTLTNERPAVDFLFEAYAVREGVGLAFPASRGEIRIEPHSDLTLKSLTEGGLRPERAVTVGGQPALLADLYRQSLCAAWVQGDQVSFGSWNDTPWALQAFAAWAPDDLTWTATGGHAMTLDVFTDAVVTKLRQETAFLRSARAAGTSVQKRKQGIFAYTCGGAHLLQGAAFAVARGFGDPSHRATIAEEVGVLIWRIDVELGAVDTAIAQYPEHALILNEQRLKFLGHFLETVHKAAAIGVFQPDDAQRVQIARVQTELIATVDALRALGAFDKLSEVRATNEQLYLDFVGDASHAVRGIDLATGAGAVWL